MSKGACKTVAIRGATTIVQALRVWRIGAGRVAIMDGAGSLPPPSGRAHLPGGVVSGPDVDGSL